MNNRLDKELLARSLVATRSQAESYIRLGQVQVNGGVITKTGYSVQPKDRIKLLASEQFVSRAGLKLASVADDLNLNFRDAVVLDVGSSTGGFTDLALKRGASKVIAIDVGTNQLHPSLRTNPKIELHEQTDIRDVSGLSSTVDIVVIDVSFISLREVLPHVINLVGQKAIIVAMVKPQFEAGDSLKHKGVIKNDKIRREILKNFENWATEQFKIINKTDSKVAGEKGNLERFYALRVLPKN